MAWQDRIREAAYTSPSGNRIVFSYEDVSRSVTKNTAAYDFPDAAGTYIQDLGRSGRRYPLRVIFWGDNYDLQASAFEDSLLEPGAGVLDHPIYGPVDVVPFGAVRRTDALVTAGNQAIVEVEFWETIGVVYPSGFQDPGSSVRLSAGEFNEAEAASFSELVDVSDVANRVTLTSSFQGLFDIAVDALRPVALLDDRVGSQFTSIANSIEQSLLSLVRDPYTLASQTLLLIQTPSRTDSSASSRLDTYAALVTNLTQETPRTPNEALVRELFVSAAISGAVLSAVNSQFDSKTEALTEAQNILLSFEGAMAWRESSYEDQEILDTGAAYQALQESVALCAGFLVFISFSLKQERTLIVDRNRTIIDLAAELYGVIDERLDFLISTNSLLGSEILEVPAGREIVYYV